jgi:hypothetical protein
VGNWDSSLSFVECRRAESLKAYEAIMPTAAGAVTVLVLM